MPTKKIDLRFGVIASIILTAALSRLLNDFAPAGIPFFGAALAGNLFYSAVLFGGFWLAQNRFPVLRPAATN